MLIRLIKKKNISTKHCKRYCSAAASLAIGAVVTHRPCPVAAAHIYNIVLLYVYQRRSAGCAFRANNKIDRQRQRQRDTETMKI